jgi:hypothetical protein
MIGIGQIGPVTATIDGMMTGIKAETTINVAGGTRRSPRPEEAA